jgi:hypothetical protein
VSHAILISDRSLALLALQEEGSGGEYRDVDWFQFFTYLSLGFQTPSFCILHPLLGVLGPTHARGSSVLLSLCCIARIVGISEQSD